MLRSQLAAAECFPSEIQRLNLTEKPDKEHFRSEFDTSTVSVRYSNNARGYFNARGEAKRAGFLVRGK
jgi:hypothetical protein